MKNNKIKKQASIHPMEAGPERELMVFLFSRVKQTKGLTTALDKQAGVNGKWLKPNAPYNISSRRLLRVILHMAHFVGQEQFQEDLHLFIDHLYAEILPLYASIQAEKDRRRL